MAHDTAYVATHSWILQPFMTQFPTAVIRYEKQPSYFTASEKRRHQLKKVGGSKNFFAGELYKITIYIHSTLTPILTRNSSAVMLKCQEGFEPYRGSRSPNPPWRCHCSLEPDFPTIIMDECSCQFWDSDWVSRVIMVQWVVPLDHEWTVFYIWLIHSWVWFHASPIDGLFLEDEQEWHRYILQMCEL